MTHIRKSQGGKRGEVLFNPIYVNPNFHTESVLIHNQGTHFNSNLFIKYVQMRNNCHNQKYHFFVLCTY